MQFHKLVRDRIPEIIKQHGEIPIIHIADEQEYHEKLREKLREEIEEFLVNEDAEELADVLEVLHALCELKHLDMQQIEAIRIEKREKRGGFAQKIILDAVEPTTTVE